MDLEADDSFPEREQETWEVTSLHIAPHFGGGKSGLLGQ